MTRKKLLVEGALGALVPLVLALLLLSGTATIRSAGWLGVVLAEVEAAFRDAATQWMVFGCVAAYFVAFSLLGRRTGGVPFWRPRNPDSWLGVAFAVAALDYGCDYAGASKSTLALALVGGAVLGKGLRVGAGWGIGNPRLQIADGKSESGKGAGVWEGRRQKAKGKSVAGLATWALVVLLAGAAVWQVKAWCRYEYRGQSRWTGPWDNPNTFGVLMGVGVVLAAGRVRERLKAKGKRMKEDRPGTLSLEPGTLNPERGTPSWGQLAARVFWLAAAAVMGVGLVKSYSRGAWLGTALALAYLAFQGYDREILGTRGKKTRPEDDRQKERSGIFLPLSFCRRLHPRIPRIPRLALSVVIVSLAVLAFWVLIELGRED